MMIAKINPQFIRSAALFVGLGLNAACFWYAVKETMKVLKENLTNKK